MTTMDRRGFVGACAAGSLASVLPAAVLPAPAFAAEPRTVAFADGGTAPALGQGSWHMAGGHTPPQEAEQAMTLGLSLGLTLIDTAEVYSNGRAEELIAPVIAGKRDKVFLVSKVWPSHATAEGIERSLHASLKRLGTDHLDLYLLHFREDADLKEVVKGFERVRAQGLTRRWGVSNFTVRDMEELTAIPGGENCATNQVLYNLAARGVESDLIPWCAKRRMPIMAYSPLGSGGRAALLANPVLKKLGEARGVGPAAIAVAWAMRDGRTITVVETASAAHVREDAAAGSLVLSAAEIKALDDAFPPPRAG